MQDGNPETLRQRIALALRTLRERADMSQSGLATAMAEREHPWHQQTVDRVEGGERKVSFEEAVDLAAILGVPLERFTWKAADANAADALYMAAERIRRQATDLVNAVGALLSATRLAERAVEDTAKYVSPRMDDAREILADALNAYELVNVVNEGIRQDAERYGDSKGGDDDGGDAESEPGLMDQRQAER